MKNLFSLLCLVVLLGVSVNVMGQGVQQTSSTDVFRNYWVNSSTGASQDVAGHTGSTYLWTIYDWDGTADYAENDGAWDAAKVAATSGTDYSFDVTNSATVFNPKIKWLEGGNYVVQVAETNNGCSTIRRFGVRVLDIDLLVVTNDHLGNPLSAVATLCNTDAGKIWGDGGNDNINLITGVTTTNPKLGTMTYTWEISLFAKETGIAADLITTVVPAARWKFTLNNNSVLPGAPSQAAITWSVSGGTGTITTTGDANVITADASSSTVTVTAVIQNVASDPADQYELDFSIDPTTVQVDLGGTLDYAEGQEKATYNVSPSHSNTPYKITVKPLPNTTAVKFN